jgi:hypothetical protein
VRCLGSSCCICAAEHNITSSLSFAPMQASYCILCKAWDVQELLCSNT